MVFESGEHIVGSFRRHNNYGFTFVCKVERVVPEQLARSGDGIENRYTVLIEMDGGGGRIHNFVQHSGKPAPGRVAQKVNSVARGVPRSVEQRSYGRAIALDFGYK